MKILFNRCIGLVTLMAVLFGLWGLYGNGSGGDAQAQIYSGSYPAPRPVRLCPRQEVRKRLEHTATVTSSEASVVQGRYEGDFVIIQAQENDTDAVRRATVTIRFRDTFMVFDQEETIPIQVLPRRQCETPQGLGTARLTGTVLDPEARVRHDDRFVIDLCENQTFRSRGFELFEREWGLTATSNNPAVATVAVEQDEDDQYQYILYAHHEGEAILRITFPMEGRNVSNSIIELHVIVKPCEPKQEPAGDKRTGFIPGVKPGFKETEQFGLKNQAYTFPQGQILLTFPSDVKPGEPVSGAILAQPNGQTPEEKAANAQQLAQYPIQIQAVKPLRMNRPRTLIW